MSEIQLRRKFFMKEQMLQMGFGLNIVLCGKMEDSIFLKEHLLRRVWMF